MKLGLARDCKHLCRLHYVAIFEDARQLYLDMAATTASALCGVHWLP